jgi:hypothetical protein
MAPQQIKPGLRIRISNIFGSWIRILVRVKSWTRIRIKVKRLQKLKLEPWSAIDLGAKNGVLEGLQTSIRIRSKVMRIRKI